MNRKAPKAKGPAAEEESGGASALLTQQEHDQLQNLLGKLREASLQLLDQDLDALGYPFQ